MSSMNAKEIRRVGAVVALAVAVTVGVASSPARAGDDGAAPIWTGIGNVIGLVKSDSDVQIDYCERGKLVLPPKIALPPPGATAHRDDGAWPVDQEVVKDKKAKAEAKESKLVHYGRIVPPIVTPGAKIAVTESATAGQGVGTAPCINKDPKSGRCPSKPSPTWNYNPLTWVGLEKKPPTVLGPEPDRDWLTDPPKGLRAPVEGVGAKADN